MPQHISLCRYGYDALDRMATRTPLAKAVAVVSQQSMSMSGFNGELLDSITGHYSLGNGYRAYNPVLMRFNNPDSLSPFGKGGLNAYAYCGGDPVNRSDPDGREFIDVLLSSVYIGGGLLTAGIGLMLNRSSIRAVIKGVKVNSDLDAPPGQLVTVPRRKANTTERISAVVAIGAVASGITWASAFVVRSVEPDSAVARPLAAVAVAFAASTLGMRSWGFARTEAAKRAARRTANIRHEEEVTRL
ncbi:RHS repeat-associated core domain-containing protein [Pseudomonas coronafaciens]|uniref:RHS repeat-associated core domain-containing protein n=1 Tax=Pseudomonas coronafaciens TaxID=53409 RepID=UPI0006D6254A|nr:RHS repeat-associated core domain-containing protein [Pseudomonas coronafaciens]